MANKSFRLKAAGAGIKLWQIADKIGISECYFSRLLRKELTGDLKERAYQALTELKEASK